MWRHSEVEVVIKHIRKFRSRFTTWTVPFDLLSQAILKFMDLSWSVYGYSTIEIPDFFNSKDVDLTWFDIKVSKKTVLGREGLHAIRPAQGRLELNCREFSKGMQDSSRTPQVLWPRQGHEGVLNQLYELAWQFAKAIWKDSLALKHTHMGRVQ
jgi:hypothetical protein